MLALMPSQTKLSPRGTVPLRSWRGLWSSLQGHSKEMRHLQKWSMLKADIASTWSKLLDTSLGLSLGYFPEQLLISAFYIQLLGNRVLWSFPLPLLANCHKPSDLNQRIHAITQFYRLEVKHRSYVLKPKSSRIMLLPTGFGGEFIPIS